MTSPCPTHARVGRAFALAVLSCAAWAQPAWAATAAGALDSPASAPAPATTDAPITTSWPAPVQAAWRASGLPAQAFSFWIAPAQAGPTSLTSQAQQPRQVASLMKLFTTGSALQLLGTDFRWHTDVGLQGAIDANGTLHGNLHVRASADPSLNVERLLAMLHQWRVHGLQRIDGDVQIDRHVLAPSTQQIGDFDGLSLRPYNALPDSFLLNYASVELLISATPSLAVRLDPALDHVDIDSRQLRLSAGPCGRWREALDVQFSPLDGAGAPAPAARAQAWRIRLSGNYPAACGEQRWPLLWPAAGSLDLVSRALPLAWAQQGGSLSGSVRDGDWPDQMPVWLSWNSPDLASVVRDINKYSNNVMARQLFLTLARPVAPTNGLNSPISPVSQAEPASDQAQLGLARERVGNWVRDHSGTPSACATNALVLDNGSGLSRQGRSSAACLGAWLRWMWRSPEMPEFLASLPIAGVDGTAQHLPLSGGRAHIKTGTLDDVVAMAGYVDDANGQRQIVVAIVNDAQAERGRGVLLALLDWVAQAGWSRLATPVAIGSSRLDPASAPSSWVHAGANPSFTNEPRQP